jgi:hypothetical protein
LARAGFQVYFTNRWPGRAAAGKLIMYPNRGHVLIIAPEFFRDVIAFLRG